LTPFKLIFEELRKVLFYYSLLDYFDLNGGLFARHILEQQALLAVVVSTVFFVLDAEFFKFHGAAGDLKIAEVWYLAVFLVRFILTDRLAVAALVQLEVLGCDVSSELSATVFSIAFLHIDTERHAASNLLVGEHFNTGIALELWV